MKIDKAIEILNPDSGGEPITEAEYIEAVKLGIEALKRVERMRRLLSRGKSVKLLRGETE